MRPAARFSPQARREIDAALRKMEHISARHRLRVAIVDASRRLAENPMLGSVRPYAPSVFRFWLLPRFGYVMVYDPAAEPVEILRFVHTRRDLASLLAGLDAQDDPDTPS